MSFQNNHIWTQNGSGPLAYGEIRYDSSTEMVPKRPYHWLLDTFELDSNKKQAMQSAKGTSEVGHANNSVWGGQIGDCLFKSKTQGITISDVNIPSIAYADLNAEKKDNENQFLNDSSISLSMSQTVPDPFFLNPGFQAIKNSEARMSENCFADFLGNSLYTEKDKVTSTTFADSTHPGRTYNPVDCDSRPTTFGSDDRNFVAAGLSSNKRDGNLIRSNQFYDRINNNIFSVGQPNSGNYYPNPVREDYGKENGTIMPTGTSYGNARKNLYAMGTFSNKVNEIFTTSGSVHNTEETVSSQQDTPVPSLRSFYNEENSSILLLGQNCKKGEQTTISFGGSRDNDFLNHSSAQALGTLERRDVPNKKNELKTSKNLSSNNFPSNVKNLLSTGILDGVPVKYVSWSREKNLRGVIKGTGYLCGCEECKLTKIINAYEFERHANCKTKHPNNHIYFENGKTIYAVVQELKNTPRETLFEVMQSVTGSPVNQKNFDTWKASYQAAMHELKRIYGRDERVLPA